MAEIAAEVLATGNELVTGGLVDTNSAHIARTLFEAGVTVRRMGAVGDDLPVLVEALQAAAGRSQVCVVTGGLGPTEDDLSALAAARALGVPLVRDPDILAWIEGLFRAINREMAPSNEKQADLPRGADPLPNPIGTAPGFTLSMGGCLFFFMPGVPREMRIMLENQVLPRIRERFPGAGGALVKKRLRTFGVTEAKIGEMISGLEEGVSGLSVGIQALFPEIHVWLYARGSDPDHAMEILEKGAEAARGRLGHWYYGEGELPLEAVAGRLLKEKNLSLALAESCTGGLVSHRITAVPGSSDYFLFSGVTYANKVKEAVLGVDPETLKDHGAVSLETAREMATGARRASGADVAVSTTGIAGPDGGTPEKPVGTVCVGYADAHGAEAWRFLFPFGERDRNKAVFASAALEVLRRKLLDLPIPKIGVKPGK